MNLMPYKQFNKNQFFYFTFIVLIVSICSFVFPDTANTYISKWSKFDESLGHGYLIALIVIFELFKGLSDYKPEKEENYHSLLLPIMLTTVFLEVSSFWGVLIFQQFSLYFIILFCLAYVLGAKLVYHLYFPLLFFFFAIPFWEFANTFFVNLTTYAVTIILNFTDLTVYIFDNFIETPYGVIEVAEGCSGLRYFEIGLALAAYAVHGEKLNWKLKLLVLLFAAALGILTNWIRVLGLIYIGYQSEMTSPLLKEHEYYGFLLFFIVISSVIFLVNWLKRHYGLPSLNSKKSEDSFEQNKALLKQSIIKLGISSVIIVSISNYISNNLASSLPAQSSEPDQLTASSAVLTSFGQYTEENTLYLHEGIKCSLISRSYYFISPGENVLPYDEIFNQTTFYKQQLYSKHIEYNGERIMVKHLIIKSRINNKESSLIYWYEYNGHYFINKYIAKLFELSYIFKSEKQMKLNIISCAQ